MDKSKIEKFKNYLSGRGAVVLDPTNEWEVVRFRTSNGVSVIYKNKHNILTWTGESHQAWLAFTQKKAWKVIDRKRQNLRARKAEIAARDGKRCFAHGEKLGFDDLTIEHLLSFGHGGTDNINNLALVCEPCNKELGTMSVTEKIEFIIQKRVQNVDMNYIQKFLLNGRIWK